MSSAVTARAGQRSASIATHLALADAGPLLLASQASMPQLNAWITTEADLPDLRGAQLPNQLIIHVIWTSTFGWASAARWKGSLLSVARD